MEQALAPAPEADKPAAPLITRSRRKAASPKLGNSLTAFTQEVLPELVEQDAQSKKDEGQPQTFAINSQVNIDETTFQKHLGAYAERLKATDKILLASLLEKGLSVLEHNCWHFMVDSEMGRNMLEREKELLPFMRDKLGVRDLYWELKVDESFVDPKDQIPYSNEEKLKAMGEKNPVLQKMQKIFTTRIIYS